MLNLITTFETRAKLAKELLESEQAKAILNDEKARKAFLKKCGFTKKGNTKLGGRMWVFSKLYGSKAYFSEFFNAWVLASCFGCCEGCEGSCYVAKSYLFRPSVIVGHAKRTFAMRYLTKELFEYLDGQMTRARKKPEQVRIDQSGEIETKEEFIGWVELARKHPETQFYIYTKRFDIVCPILDEYGDENIPENFVVLFSVWHTYGLDIYKKYEHFRCVKAFVYLDPKAKGGWGVEEYAKHGLIIQTFCKAYDINGRMNHEITCDKCQKCIECRKNAKVIGCFDHA